MARPELHVTSVPVAVYQERGSRFRFRGERHGGLYELFCLDRGRAFVRTAGKRFSASPGDCFLYLPGTFHQHQATQGQAPHYITVAFTAKGGGALRGLAGRRFTVPPRLRALLARIVEESAVPRFAASRPMTVREGSRRSKSNPPRLGAAALRCALLTQFLVEWLRLDEDLRRRPRGKTDLSGPAYRERSAGEAVARALEFLEANLARPVGVEDAARAAGVSPSYMRQLVRARKRSSLREELRRMRMRRARHLLGHSTRNVKEVAAAVGYENLAAFGRAFRAVEGISPGAYARTVGAQARV